MKKTSIRIASALLSACLTLTLFSGCGKGPAKTASDTGGTSAGEMPISKEKITLKILKPLVMYDTDYSKMPVLQDFEAKSNIHIEWNSPAQADFTSKYNLLMSSGQLPDAIIAMPTTDIEKYGQQGALISLNSLISKNMPNLKKVFEKYPASKKVVTSAADGKIYSLPFVYQQRWGNNVPIIREDWLKKLNLSMPQTIDDWYNVLKAFKEKDPNGNGKADELPFNGSSIYALTSFAMAWGVHPGNTPETVADDFYVADKLAPKDGKIHFSLTEPRFKEAVEFMHKLYAEGLVDPEIVTNDTKSYQAKMMQNVSGATRGVFGGDMSTMNISAQKNGMKDFHLVVAPVIKGPYGDQVHTYPDPAALPNGFVITKANKHPTETARWADYWYGTEGQRSMMGVEGKTYTMTDEGPKWTDYVVKNPEGKTQAEVWGSYTPGRSIWPTVWLPASIVLDGDTAETRDAKVNILKPELLVEPLPTNLSFSTQDNEKRTQLLGDLSVYANESIVNFIYGKQPLSEWDSYVSKAKSMGLDELLKLYQKSYDQWKTIK